MALEIERKFLVCGDFKTFAYKYEDIAQGYLSTDPDRSVRVRKKGDRAYLTIKGKSSANGISRYEWEKEISLSDANQLLLLCESLSIIDKTRYYIKTKNSTLEFEVDEFHGDNNGLIIAEMELDSENQEFEKPDWIGTEVTGDQKYYNSQLSKNPYSKWTEND